MSGASVQVPVVRPASYAPAWEEKAAGLRVSRTLDLADLLADRRVRLTHVAVSLEPPLMADEFDITDLAVSFFLVDMPVAAAKTRWRVRFDLQYSDGSQDEITVFQPIGADAPAGLVAADVSATSLSIGGEAITINGQTIHV